MLLLVVVNVNDSSLVSRGMDSKPVDAREMQAYAVV